MRKASALAKIIVDPSNSNNVCSSARALWSDSEERGVYKTIDGGKTWSRLLYVNPSTGCASLAMDPNNPQVLYAAMWDHRRTAYDFRSGGPGSGLYKSTDGGANWTKLSAGLPEGTIGRIAVAVSKVAPYSVYALVESEKSALYKSVDNGANWLKMSDQNAMGERPFTLATYRLTLLRPIAFTNRVLCYWSIRWW
ncbi:MAG: hypothetical protein IPO03_01955 [Bacteroidetes bacterium]|nr:hypothetical protein [Bacteroidota bacterium]